LDLRSQPRTLCPASWSSEDMERRLAAIVCADVAGYSRMMGTDEEGTHATFKAHRAAIYPTILNHGGRLVKNTGDGFLLEFPSVVGAVEASIAMQTMMAERNAQIPPDRVMSSASAPIWAT
jgi:adenylate cyclase